ncbi:MAG: galactose mutarotase [Sphingobacteriales bacterium]|nr:galactose mutarotase [Sphingobacteriales bacterium]
MEVNTIGQSLAKKQKEEIADKIKLFTIENDNGTKLVASNYGAAVVSLFVKDKSGNLSDIVLGYPQITDYVTDDFYVGTVVGRYANRIADSKVLINERPFHLSVNGEGYHQHGGFEGFNKKLFSAEPFKKDKESGIVFTYISPHLEEGYPGELTLEVKYTLTDNDQWKIDYKATTTQDTLINLTQHAYFNLSGDLSKRVDEHDLKINSEYYLPVNKFQLPTGELASVDNTPFDFRQFKTIGKDIEKKDEQLSISKGYDHSFVLKDQTSGELKLAAIVTDKITGRKMEVYTTEPAVHFYSGNFLHNVNGKDGVKYNERSGFCLETQHYPDAPNHHHFPSTVLKAGKIFNSQTIFSFSTE